IFLTLPLLVYLSFDSSAAIGKPQTNCLGAFNRCRGLKGKTSLRDIQDNATVVRVEIDIGGSVHSHPWTVASFRHHGRYSPGHPSAEDHCSLFVPGPFSGSSERR